MTLASSTDARHSSPGARQAGARRTRASGPALTTLRTPGLEHAVELHDSDPLFHALCVVMPDWPLAVRPGSAPADTPVTRVARDRDAGYGFHSWWADSALTDLGIAGATCGVIADLTQAHLDAQPGVFGLHCGAVRIGGHLVAFTGTYRAGKSTLVTRLGAEPGLELFCDDVLPIIAPDGAAVAMGVRPRLRLPLPDGISGEFRDHIARNLTVHDHRYGYVATPQQASRGTRAPLAALVVLSRQDGAKARFHELRASDAAAYLIRQNIADPGEIDAHYDRVAAMAEGMVRLTLVYSDLEEAAALIRRTFDAPEIPRLHEPPGPPLPRTDPDEMAEPADLTGEFARAENVLARQIGFDTFLWQMDGRNFFSLNPVGGAVWALLEEPASGTEIAALLCDAFPDAPPPDIARDVARLLGQMSNRGIVTRNG